MSEPKLFNVGIKGVILKDDKVLMIKSNDAKGLWGMPGGRMDDHGTIKQTLRRELAEELPNIKNVQINNILDAYRVPHDIKPGASLALIFYAVTADFDGDPQISDEHIDWNWATKDEALSVVAENCKMAIEAAFSPAT